MATQPHPDERSWHPAAVRQGSSTGAPVAEASCPGQRPARSAAGLSLLIATCWWLAALVSAESSSAEVTRILSVAGLVVGLCFGVGCVVRVCVPRWRSKEALFFTHFLQGLLVFVAYLVMYGVEPAGFLANWRSVYFGYYIYDIAVLLLRWRYLPQTFRVFYSVHHTVSFLITGLWMVIGGPWLDYIALGVVTWLTSDLWVYALSMYRVTHGRQLSPAKLVRLQLAVFWIERFHRLLAYLVPCILAGFQLSTLALVIFGTGLANDALDVVFQWRSMRRRLSRARRTRRRPDELGQELSAAA